MFKKIFTWIRFLGILLIPLILRYTIAKAWQDFWLHRTLNQQLNGKRWKPGDLAGVESTISGLRCRFENALLSIDFLTADMVRFTWEPGRLPHPYAIEKKDWPKVHTSMKAVGDEWQLTSAAIQILIRRDGSLDLLSPSGDTLRQETSPEFFGNPKNPGWISRILLRSEECLYGLGEQAGSLNLRGSKHLIWNTDPKGGYSRGADPIYMPLPIYFGLNENGSYMAFYENSYPATFDFSSDPERQENACQVIFEQGALRYYFISGRPDEALRKFTQLTGRPPIPPKWSLGYHHSRWGFGNDQEIRNIAAEFANQNMPISAIHLDIDHMRGFRTLTIDENRFPNLLALANDLNEAGIKLVSIVNPGVKTDPDYSIYQEGVLENSFATDKSGKPVKGVVWPGWSVYPDFTDPKTRKWWKKQYQILLNNNIAGFWHDMNEPTSFSLSASMDLPSNMLHKMDGSAGNHRQAHNLYGLLMNRSGFEASCEFRPDKRPWLLSRSGWVSQQRYTWNWTGDVDSSWDAMRMTIAALLGLGLSGIPYCGSDIGGFSGNPSPDLFLRWFQMSTFVPFFRTHSAITTMRREPWIFGEPFTSIIKKYLNFRYQLMPYLYTLAWQTSQTGLPLTRPLFWLDPQDKDLWEIEDSFLLGENLLVVPILNPDERLRNFYLPQGKWTSWWDGCEYRGPGRISVDVTLEDIPIFVKAGSLIPLEERGSLYLHIMTPEATGQTSQQFLYTDEGDGYADYRLDRFQIERQANRLTIDRNSEGTFPFLYNKIYIQIHNLQGQKYFIDDQEVCPKNQILETNLFEKIEIEI